VPRRQAAGKSIASARTARSWCWMRGMNSRFLHYPHGRDPGAVLDCSGAWELFIRTAKNLYCIRKTAAANVELREPWVCLTSWQRCCIALTGGMRCCSWNGRRSPTWVVEPVRREAAYGHRRIPLRVRVPRGAGGARTGAFTFDLHLTGLASEHGYEGQSHWLMFLFEVKRKLTALPPAHREGRFQFFPREALPGLKIPQTDRERIWPGSGAPRGFFAAHCHCHPMGERVGAGGIEGGGGGLVT